MIMLTAAIVMIMIMIRMLQLLRLLLLLRIMIIMIIIMILAIMIAILMIVVIREGVRSSAHGPHGQTPAPVIIVDKCSYTLFVLSRHN